MLLLHAPSLGKLSTHPLIDFAGQVDKLCAVLPVHPNINTTIKALAFNSSCLLSSKENLRLVLVRSAHKQHFNKSKVVCRNFLPQTQIVRSACDCIGDHTRSVVAIEGCVNNLVYVLSPRTVAAGLAYFDTSGVLVEHIITNLQRRFWRIAERTKLRPLLTLTYAGVLFRDASMNVSKVLDQLLHIFIFRNRFQHSV